MSDPNGNVNNWVFVSRPEPAPGERERTYLLQQRHFQLLQQIENQIAGRRWPGGSLSHDVPMSDDTPHLLTERIEPVRQSHSMM